MITILFQVNYVDLSQPVSRLKSYLVAKRKRKRMRRRKNRRRRCCWCGRHKVSNSPTFYEHLLLEKVFCEAFVCLH